MRQFPPLLLFLYLNISCHPSIFFFLTSYSLPFTSVPLLSIILLFFSSFLCFLTPHMTFIIHLFPLCHASVCLAESSPLLSSVLHSSPMFTVHPLFAPGCHGGVYQRKLYRDLMENYNRLERPVQNDSAPIVVELGLTLLQIIDVVSVCACVCLRKAEVQSMFEDRWKKWVWVELIWKSTQRVGKKKWSWHSLSNFLHVGLFFSGFLFCFVCVKVFPSDLSTVTVVHANAHTLCLLHFIFLWT